MSALNALKKAEALRFVAYAVDDALSPRRLEEIPNNARFVGWECGFEPMFVAVWSYLDVRLDDEEAEEIATDYLAEIDWFDDEPTEADYIL